MIFGIASVLIAGFLHSWYAGSAARPGAASRAFDELGTKALFLSIVLWVLGAVLIAISRGWALGLVAVGVYFFVLPLIMVPLLHRLGLIPDERPSSKD